MQRLTIIFLYLFLADQVLSVADILAKLHLPDPGVRTIAALLSLLVLAYEAFLFVAMAFTPRLLKRILLPPIVFTGISFAWLTAMGGKGAMFFSLAGIILATGLIMMFRNRPGEKPSLRDYAKNRPGFTLKNFLLTGLLNGALALCFLAAIVLALGERARLGLENGTGRYVTIQPGGIALEERTFQRDGKEIRLIGMMHIAREGFYDEVARALPADSTAIVLLEGVTDRNGKLAGKFDYANLARALGIASQKTSSFSKQAENGLEEARVDEANGTKPKNLEYRSADVDLSDFTPETIEFLGVVGRMLRSRDAASAMKEYSQSSQALEHDVKYVQADILDKRNEHLLGEIKQALENHTTVVVPWGAQHMPGVQKAIEDWGFVETNRSQHIAVLFKNKMLVALITLLDHLPGELR